MRIPRIPHPPKNCSYKAQAIIKLSLGRDAFVYPKYPMSVKNASINFVYPVYHMYT